MSGPWRGRLLDTKGLRRVVLPSLVVTAICWSIAPFVDYLPLLLLAALAGLFVVPTFSIIRQAVIAAVPESDRRTALSLDSVAVEVSFMVGPLVGVWAATIWPTAWVLFTIEMLGVLAGVGLWLADPVMHADRGGIDADDQPLPRRAWFRPQFLAMCAAAAATTIVLSGCDIAFVAALRDFDKVSPDRPGSRDLGARVGDRRSRLRHAAPVDLGVPAPGRPQCGDHPDRPRPERVAAGRAGFRGGAALRTDDHRDG